MALKIVENNRKPASEPALTFAGGTPLRSVSRGGVFIKVGSTSNRLMDLSTGLVGEAIDGESFYPLDATLTIHGPEVQP